MSEASPLLFISLARYRQLRQQQEERDTQQQQQQQMSRQMSRRRSASPILPVIHEDEQSSHASGLTASPGSNHSRALVANAAAINNSSFTSSSSSGSDCRYANFNSMSDRIVWPPEDGSWPPNTTQNVGDNDQEIYHNYGSISAEYFDGSECYISSSPSSSDSSGSREHYHRRHNASKRRRYVQSLSAAFFAVSLSAVIWVPLLQHQQYEATVEHSSDTRSKPPAWLYFKQRHKYDEEDDDYVDSSSQGYPFSDSYRHFYKTDGSNNGSDSNSLKGIKDSKEHTQSVDRIGIGNFSSIPDNISFADLAAVMLPPYFQKAVVLCASTITPAEIQSDKNGSPFDKAEDESHRQRVNTTSLMPGEVYLLREQMLKTRDLLDIFSPVYFKHSSLDNYEDEASRMKHLSWGEGGHKIDLTLESDRPGKAKKKRDTSESSDNVDGDKANTEIKDLWRSLRKFLDDGYTLIGEFQDLDHARIRYTPEQLAKYQLLVWDWYDEFDQFIENHQDHISLYLFFPCKKKHPSSKHARCRHTHSHSSHLFWADTPKNKLPDGNKEMASSALMRLGRLQLERASEYLRQSLTFDHMIPAHNATENDIVHGHCHSARKELRSFLDEVQLFGNLIVPGLVSISEIKRSSPTSRSVPSSLEQEQTNQSLSILEQTRKHLGDLNDYYVAYSVYVEWDEYPDEQERLQHALEAQWEDFQIWVQGAEVFTTIQFLLDKMNPKESPVPKSAQAFIG
mmetsp:Transcript_40747/g.85599  ORF Transcript_40747/g.85599 Transcript_40747/m.85599 type:complete len:736 (+) Transcript_40747:73-2280(+)